MTDLIYIVTLCADRVELHPADDASGAAFADPRFRAALERVRSSFADHICINDDALHWRERPAMPRGALPLSLLRRMVEDELRATFPDRAVYCLNPPVLLPDLT